MNLCDGTGNEQQNRVERELSLQIQELSFEFREPFDDEFKQVWGGLSSISGKGLVLSVNSFELVVIGVATNTNLVDYNYRWMPFASPTNLRLYM